MGVLLRTFAMIAAGTLVAGLAAGCGSDEGDAGSVATDSASPTASESASPTVEATPSTATESDSPSETAAPASWPDCGDAWVADADLPSPYKGCAEAGIAVPADSIHCSMGALLVTYDNRFWGVPGHVISQADGPLKKDPRYRQARATCTA